VTRKLVFGLLGFFSVTLLWVGVFLGTLLEKQDIPLGTVLEDMETSCGQLTNCTAFLIVGDLPTVNAELVITYRAENSGSPVFVSRGAVDTRDFVEQVRTRGIEELFTGLP
jgi:hypothetical protein